MGEILNPFDKICSICVPRMRMRHINAYTCMTYMHARTYTIRIHSVHESHVCTCTHEHTYHACMHVYHMHAYTSYHRIHRIITRTHTHLPHACMHIHYMHICVHMHHILVHAICICLHCMYGCTFGHGSHAVHTCITYMYMCQHASVPLNLTLTLILVRLTNQQLKEHCRQRGLV